MRKAGLVLFVVLACAVLGYRFWQHEQRVRLTIARETHTISSFGDIHASEASTLRVGVIGDSISRIGDGRIADAMSQMLVQVGRCRRVVLVNDAVPQTDTEDWQPNRTLLPRTTQDFQANRCRYVILMLGTNDSRAKTHTTTVAYRTNLSRIISALTPLGITVILMPPPLPTAGAYQGAWNSMSPTLVQGYQAEMKHLDNGRDIRCASEGMSATFAAHPDYLRDGIHPNEQGCLVAGVIWADDFLHLAH